MCGGCPTVVVANGISCFTSTHILSGFSRGIYIYIVG